MKLTQNIMCVITVDLRIDNKEVNKLNDVILIVTSIIGVIITLYVLYSMPTAFLKEFEKSCHESIEKRNKELEEKEKLNRDLRKWLFK